MVFKITGEYIYSVFRHLTVVVVFLWAILSLPSKAPASYSTVSPASITLKKTGKSAVNYNQTHLKGKISSKRIKQKTSLEVTIPALHLLVKLPLGALSNVPKSSFFILQKQLIPSYAARAPGKSFISRIFPITIQPNAP